MNIRPPALVGASAPLVNLRRDIEDAARCDAKVLITGESGVGKEVVAQLIHAGSGRRAGPLVTVNCAAFTETLLETELFGHARGAFTDAYRDRAGMFELAHRGTVFMDEIGETSPRMQSVLLRFLETGEVQRVGSDRPHVRVDVRIVAATNRVLMDRVRESRFREDLYYRLNVIHIPVPPLRDHREDIPALLEHFLQSFSITYRAPVSVLPPPMLAALCAYDWPGNVRELKNVVERLMARRSERDLTLDDLPREITARVPDPAGAPPVAAVSLADTLYERVVVGGENFWDLVHAMFMARDLTRTDLRAIVRRGLLQTGGNYCQLVAHFGMPASDYKRFLSFLRKYQCQLPLHQFRGARSGAPDDPVEVTAD